MSGKRYSEYALRLAVLEERTSPKPKSIADWFKDWAGVGTLIIALLYSFPLGVWDRFLANPVEKLRDTAVRLAQLDAEFLRTYNSIVEPDARAGWSRAMGSQKTAIITRSLEDIERYHNHLTAPELVLLAYNLGQSGNFSTAEKVYIAAGKKAKRENAVWLEADVFRMLANLYRAGPSGIELSKVRENYSKSIGAIAGLSLSVYGIQASNSAYEWAITELSVGDWACGMALGDWAV